MVKVRVLALLASLLLAGCGETIETFGGPTMGSHYSVKYVSGPGTPSTGVLQAEVQRLLDEVDQAMSTWRADSALSRFNQLPAGSCAPMPPSVLELVRYGLELGQLSDGSFDMTLEPLLNLWGFGPQSRGEQVPSAEALAAARALAGHAHLRIEQQQLCKDVALQLDLNSMGAGYTVDRVAARLEELGVHHYLIDITGELRAAGHKPDGSAWRIAIEAPRADRQVEYRELLLDGLGVSTSGDYRNYFEQDGQRYSHTLDPQTGAPIRHRLASVTVVHPQALKADGLSTLLMVLGPERGLVFARQHGIAAFFVTRAGEGFVSQASPAFQRLFGEE